MVSSLYFANLRSDDCSATNPAETNEIAAIVSAIVTSQITHLSADNGTKVLPSGRLPSVLVSPVDSLTAIGYQCDNKHDR